MMQEVEHLIAEIARHEEIIQDISAKIVVTIPEKDRTFIEAQWGYSHGCEYIEGTRYLDVAEVGERIPHVYKSAFDGEIMRLYGDDPLVKRHTGRVTSLEPWIFTGSPKLSTLLGHHAHPSGRLTLAEALRQAREVSVQPGMQDVDGHPCYVVEAVEIHKPAEPGRRGEDVRLWIDPERDYRLLRQEGYYSEPPPLRWKEIFRRVDNIKLCQIDGVWIPVEGESTALTVEEVPKPGVSVEELEKMDPEEALSYIAYEVVPMLPMKRVEVDPDTVAFGQEIPAEKFTIQWPEGTIIWDDFLQTSYKISARALASLEDLGLDGSTEAPAPTSSDDTHKNADVGERGQAFDFVVDGVAGLNRERQSPFSGACARADRRRRA